MATKRGLHQRPANQDSSYQQAANQQGSYQQSISQQDSYQQQSSQQGTSQQARGQRSANRQPSAAQQAYERAYRSYVNQQRASQRGQYTQQAGPGGRQQAAYQQRGDNRQQGYAQQGYAQQGYAQYGNGAYMQQNPRGWEPVAKKKGHPVRNTLLVLLFVLIVIGGIGGYTGYTLYNSAKTVRADAAVVMTDISDLKSQILSDNPSQANSTAADIAKRAQNMKKETDGWEWTVASYIPVYGGDVAKVKELANILDELSQEAVIPLVGEVSQVSLKNLFVDGGINVEYAKQLVNAVDAAAPVIDKCTSRMEAMGEAKLDQVNEPLKKAKASLGTLNKAAQFVDGIAPTFADMIGADGAPRTYLLCAQQPSEVRSTGGLIGAVGSMTIDNGRLSLKEFRTVGDIYPDLGAAHFETTEEEDNGFGSNAGWVPSTTNYIPDWSRVSQIIAFYWEQRGYGSVDGVIGIDPVFLQHLLALTGPVTTPSGYTVDGSNTAQFLGHDVYYIPNDDVQNALFTEIGSLVFDHLLNNMSSVSMMTLAQQLRADMATRHLQIYMYNENEEKAIELLGADGKLPTDPEKPRVGVYSNDDSWSKLCWYLKVSSEVGEGVSNSDGTTTYHVVTRLSNMIQPGTESELSESMVAHNVKEVRSPADMMQWVMLSAPAGGSISNLSTEGYFTSDMREFSYQGVQMFTGHAQFDAGETITLTYDVTVAKEAKEKLGVITSPIYQEVAGW